MPLTKLVFKPGVNKENTRYYNENGWYDSNRVRFRQGTPEQIGGWVRLSANTFVGLCRSLWNWITLSAQNLLGVGTNKRFYIELGGAYNDVTPVRRTVTLTNPFTATNGSSSILVTDPGHQCALGDYVTFSGAGITGLGGNITAGVLTGEFTITSIPSTSTYTITVGAVANATDAAGSPGGGTVVTQYLVNVGEAIVTPLTGWGSGGWGVAAWGGTGSGLANPSAGSLRVWNQQNFGEDLIYGPNGGLLYYWDATQGLTASTFTVTIASPAVLTLAFAPTVGMAIRLNTTGALPTGLTVGTTYYVINVAGTTCQLTATYGGAAITTSGAQSGTHTVSQRGIPISQLPGASDTPLFCNVLQISDTSRFVFAMGTNEVGTTVVDPMLVRWSDQESAANWTPAITNQAGSVRLSNGWKIVVSLFIRQELLVWTTSALYSFQYLGPPYVWGSQLMGDNISIISTRAAALASGTAYWMGVDKFYAYNGRVNTLRCDLRQFIFGDINMNQAEQFFAGTNEGFSEVWWFYCSASSDTINRYVIYNYAEDVWYHGRLARTAWLDTPLREFPTAATYSLNVVSHEVGTDDNETGTPQAMDSSITSAEFDIGDGHNFGFVWRMLPDMTFRGSSAAAPAATLTLNTLQNSGSGYNAASAAGGTDSAGVVQTTLIPVEEFTGEVYVRVRGRQMSITVAANQVGTTWQLGAPRIDVRGDGRKS
jgi:hypothetical protein